MSSLSRISRCKCGGPVFAYCNCSTNEYIIKCGTCSYNLTQRDNLDKIKDLEEKIINGSDKSDDDDNTQTESSAKQSIIEKQIQHLRSIHGKYTFEKSGRDPCDFITKIKFKTTAEKIIEMADTLLNEDFDIFLFEQLLKISRYTIHPLLLEVIKQEEEISDEQYEMIKVTCTFKEIQKKRINKNNIIDTIITVIISNIKNNALEKKQNLNTPRLLSYSEDFRQSTVTVFGVSVRNDLYKDIYRKVIFAKKTGNIDELNVISINILGIPPFIERSIKHKVTGEILIKKETINDFCERILNTRLYSIKKYSGPKLLQTESEQGRKNDTTYSVLTTIQHSTKSERVVFFEKLLTPLPKIVRKNEEEFKEYESETNSDSSSEEKSESSESEEKSKSSESESESDLDDLEFNDLELDSGDDMAMEDSGYNEY